MPNNIMQLHINDIIELKKSHPCGNKSFKILRLGADIKIECCECGRTISLDRIKLEKMIKKFISGEENK